MLLQIGEQQVLENILLGMKANDIPLPNSNNEFRPAYQRYLKVMQPHCCWLRPDAGAGIQATPVDPDARKALIAIFQDETSHLDDLGQANVVKSGAHDRKNENIVNDAIAKMRLAAPTHFEFLNLCIEHIFFEGSDSASGGSTSSAVGAIWANPHPTFSVDDTLEFLVHELTHNLMFLDEWVHPHYKYEAILNPETWCQSAILRTKRPLDKVVHSVVVATEIVLLRRRLIGGPTSPMAHPPTADIIAAVTRSIGDVRTMAGERDYIYPRVWQLLENIEHKLSDASVNPAARNTRSRERDRTPLVLNITVSDRGDGEKFCVPGTQATPI